jgi:hypothetical protein
MKAIGNICGRTILAHVFLCIAVGLLALFLVNLDPSNPDASRELSGTAESTWQIEEDRPTRKTSANSDNTGDEAARDSDYPFDSVFAYVRSRVNLPSGSPGQIYKALSNPSRAPPAV